MAVSSICTHAADPFSFRTTILPVLTKAGCNAGACHGAATGQGGFKLSLLGYDPEEDYERVTRELGGRRLDFAAPGESLFLRKPTHQLDHEGGRRIRRDSQAYQTLLRWIATGAPYGRRELQVKEVAVAPAEILLAQRTRRCNSASRHSSPTARRRTRPRWPFTPRTTMPLRRPAKRARSSRADAD